MNCLIFSHLSRVPPGNFTTAYKNLAGEGEGGGEEEKEGGRERRREEEGEGRE
jgi:hypothetical protein